MKDDLKKSYFPLIDPRVNTLLFKNNASGQISIFPQRIVEKLLIYERRPNICLYQKEANKE